MDRRTLANLLTVAIITMAAVFNTGKRNRFYGLFKKRNTGESAILYAFQRHLRETMDISNIDSMLAQLRAGAALAGGKAGSAETIANGNETGSEAGRVDFATVFRRSLDQVNNVQQHASKLARDFELGAPEANLTEAMISLQKASISFQYTVQVRNKLVAAYQDIMNMPV
jgi:flagellar hook-basal body complex protein FliE